jgi:hypothetical protein
MLSLKGGQVSRKKVRGGKNLFFKDRDFLAVNEKLRHALKHKAFLRYISI